METAWLVVLALGVTPVLNNPVARREVRVGQAEAALRKHYPRLERAGPSQWSQPDRLGSLDGKWVFELEGGRVAWYNYSVHFVNAEDVNASNFARLLEAADDLVKQLTRKHGAPQSKKDGTRRFRDPAKDHHWGYDVLDARWVTQEESFRVRFFFFGGKGTYFLALVAEFHPPGYTF